MWIPAQDLLMGCLIFLELAKVDSLSLSIGLRRGKSLELALEAYMENIVQELKAGVGKLTDEQASALHRKLDGLYNRVTSTHPLPDRPPHIFLGPRSKVVDSIANTRHKRLEEQNGPFQAFLDIASPACPSRAAWQNLTYSRDIEDNEVQVYQPEKGSTGGSQWFYTVSCDNMALMFQRECEDCCIGIDSMRYVSSCRPKASYVMARARKLVPRNRRERRYEWKLIQVNTSCNCAIATTSLTLDKRN